MEVISWIIWFLFTLYVLVSGYTFLFVNNPHAAIEHPKVRIALTTISTLQILAMLATSAVFLVYDFNKFHLLWIGPSWIIAGMVASLITGRIIYILFPTYEHLDNQEERGYRFVPISTGLFFLILAVGIFWIWGENIITIVICSPLLYFAWSSLKIGIWGSQQLIDEMNLKGELSEKGREEWEKIHDVHDKENSDRERPPPTS